ncbi:excisionase [Luteibacter aegosomaticola]|uniref:excisionase n=1 Tax=Luteibacter aegosomaticola TaxID=2911538 RepID=UPI001FF74C0F|nr:excisionase [Luteibacter aegosomaticola]UPG88484.1 excisionase [Luteibacter aegosomaticola]
MIRYVTIGKFAAESGYSENAVRAKIKNSVWLEGNVWKHAPDGRVLIDTEGYEKWVDGQMASEQLRKAA